MIHRAVIDCRTIKRAMIKYSATPSQELLQGRGTRALLGATLAFAITLLGAPTTAAAQNQVDGTITAASAGGSSSGTAVAARTDVAPVIDGVPDEEAWMGGPVLSDFTQREPSDGDPASERTEVRVIYDDEAIYVGVWAWDSQVDQLVPGDAIRDYEVTDADAILMIFDTYKDERNGFVFGTTPAGIEYDGQVSAGGTGGGGFLGGGGGGGSRFQLGSGGGFNKNWDGSWTVAASSDDRGWYAEFRIPFSTLRYSSDQGTWGFNVARRVRRLNEESFWTAVPREFNLYRLEFAGDLTGLEPPFQRSATVTPYVLGSTARDYAAGDPSFGQDLEVGGEAKVQLTQSLTLDVTANTDFAQVEVDNAQVNLTRFSLLFPEKRLFFLENAGFFNVGGGGADLFFSRRIGISDGQPVPIKAGGRLSGRAAGLNLGLLHIETDGPLGANDGNAYSVARVAKELPSRSRVGALFVNRDGDIAGDHNRTYAFDANVGLGDQITISSWAARTETPELNGDEHAWDVTAGLASRDWRANATIREIGQNFNPEVGFLPRNGHRYYQAFAMYYIRPNRFFRELRPHISYFTFRSQRDGIASGFEESARWHIDNHWQWDSGMELHTGANYVTEGLYEPFEIRGTDVTVPEGSYAGWESQIVFFTDQSRLLSLNSRFNWGSFLSGSKRTSSADVTARIGARSSATASFAYNDVDLPEGEFTTTLASFRAGYFFTPRLYLQSLIQYSDQIDSWSANVRFGWLNTAGTGLFIVYNEVQGIDSLIGPQGRSLIFKFTRQFGVLGN